MIQESAFGKACAQNFDQAQPMQKVPPIRNRGHFLQIESLGCRRSQNRFLNHFRYKELYEKFILDVSAQKLKVQTGIFGAKMQVSLVNDGAVTLILDAK